MYCSTDSDCLLKGALQSRRKLLQTFLALQDTRQSTIKVGTELVMTGPAPSEHTRLLHHYLNFYSLKSNIYILTMSCYHMSRMCFHLGVWIRLVKTFRDWLEASRRIKVPHWEKLGWGFILDYINLISATTRAAVGFDVFAAQLLVCSTVACLAIDNMGQHSRAPWASGTWAWTKRVCS